MTFFENLLNGVFTVFYVVLALLFYQVLGIFISTFFYGVLQIKKRFPNPAFRGGMNVLFNKKGFISRMAIILLPLYSPDPGGPFRYLVCVFLMHGKFSRSA